MTTTKCCYGGSNSELVVSVVVVSVLVVVSVVVVIVRVVDDNNKDNEKHKDRARDPPTHLESIVGELHAPLLLVGPGGRLGEHFLEVRHLLDHLYDVWQCRRV